MWTGHAERHDGLAGSASASLPPRARRRRRPAMVQTAALGVAVLLLGLPGAIGVGPTETPTGSADALGDAYKAAKAAPRGYFEPNHGQFPEHVRFVVHGAGTNVFLTDGGATFVLEEPVSLPAPLADSSGDPFLGPLLEPVAPPEPASLFAVQLRFEDADPGTMEGTEPRQSISNHFIGNDPDKWVTNVPHYGRVVQRDVWPGIDIEWHIAPEGLKFDAVVHPGADPNLVRFTLPGAEGLTLDAAGDLVIGTPFGSLVKEAPYTYQETPEGVQEVPSRYVLAGGTVGFGLGAHDATRPLVIDPLLYSTYLGGGGQDDGMDIAVDDEGHAYVTGFTIKGDFPTEPGSFRRTPPGSTYSAFVTKLNPAGDALVYSTYLGGTDMDRGLAIAVDAHGNAYLTGSTFSADFPTTPNAYQSAFPGAPVTAFFTKLNATGGHLDTSTYLGGSVPAPGGGTGSHTHGQSIAVDAAGSAYIVGRTLSGNFPAPGPPGGAFPQHTGQGQGDVAFVAKFTPEGDDLEYASYLGGSPTTARGIAVDADGSAYVVGTTRSQAPLPATPGAFQQQQPSPPSTPLSRPPFGDSAFVTKFTPDGWGLMYSTYLGGTGDDVGLGIAVDGDGHAYVYGTTTSGDFPTENPYQGSNPGGRSAFLTKMNLDGTGLMYSTYLGGTGTEGQPIYYGANHYTSTRVAVDADGRAYVTGPTSSGNSFPLRNPYQEAGGTFVTAFQPDGSDVLWSTLFPGASAMSVAVDAVGSAYITGSTSGGLPILNAYQDAYGGSSDAFIAKLYGLVADFDWSPDPPCPGEPVRFRDLSVSLSGTAGGEELPVRSQWDFGDGSNPLILDPWQNVATHTYFEEGNHNVTLTAADAFGSSASVTRVVEVPWCPPPNHAPSLRALPCIIASPEQKLSFQVRATVPVLAGDPPSYSNLTFSAEGLPSGATFQQDGPLAARITWTVGPPDTYTFVVHVEDEGLPEHDVPSLGDSEEYCIEVRPEKPAPGRDDDSGDGAQNWHDACPHVKNPDQADAANGIDDPCEPAAPAEPEETPEEQGPPPGGCPARPAGPREVTARWTDGAVQVTWQSDSWCPPDHFLVWNGTGHHLVDFVVAEAGVHYVVLNLDPWPAPHQYFVQAMGADEGLFFDPSRAVASNLIDPAGCILEGPRSEACLLPGIGEEPPAAVEPAAPEAAAPADGAPMGLIAAAVALVVGGLMALLWRLRHAPWVVHLFSRLGPDDVLGHPVRKQIMDLVTAEPGLHYTEIMRRVGKGRGAVRHHLTVLAAARLVRERKTGRFVCYYPAEGTDSRVRGVGGLLRSDTARRLLRLLQDEPGLPVAELARQLQADPTAVRYHLRRFEAQDLARVERGARNSKVYPGALTKDALATLVPGNSS